MIEEYGRGFLYKPGEGIDVIAENISALRKNRARYETLSKKCSLIAEEEFSLLKFGNRLVGLYQSMVVKV